MNLFLIASCVPSRHHGQPGVTAVHVIANALLGEFIEAGHQVYLQIIFNVHRTMGGLTEFEMSQMDALHGLGACSFPPIYPEQYVRTPRPRTAVMGRLVRRLVGKVPISNLYPAIKVCGILRERVMSSGAEAILTIASPEGVAATHELVRVPRIAYQGDIDFRPAEARMADHALFVQSAGNSTHGSIVRKALQSLWARVWLSEFKSSHIALMRKVDVIANLTASNVGFYRQQGHPRAIYVPNTWIDEGATALNVMSEKEQNGSAGRTIKIIGHVGYLDRTGSTYGLKCLLDTLPILEQLMRGLDYEIHIIGGGEVAPVLRPRLEHNRLLIRGFVADLDSELKSSDMFLLLNNCGPYQAAFTRHMIAWSMGLCLIAHTQSKMAIPEIEHMQNALLGETPAEIARLVYLAATDADLNRRIRQEGRATYERFFTPRIVAHTLGNETSLLIDARRRQEMHV